MDMHLMRRHFASIGADLRIDVGMNFRSRRTTTRGDYRLDIEERKNRERFVLSIREEMATRYEFLTLDRQPEGRHLLLLARRLDTGEKRKFLCGHDERHWFVAGVPDEGGITGVRQAMDALKPKGAMEAQLRSGVKGKDWHRRRNGGFIRRGEWFFVPSPDFRPDDPTSILRNEPLRRGAGKPHVVRELYRTGGTTVYVSNKHPNGLTTSEYRAHIAAHPDDKWLDWRVMSRDPEVFVRGTVRHRDHQTIELPFWHRVLLSNERNDVVVAFLD